MCVFRWRTPGGEWIELNCAQQLSSCQGAIVLLWMSGTALYEG